MRIVNDTRTPAPRWRRLLATAIDAVLVPGLTLLLVMITGVVEDAQDYVDNAWALSILLLAIVSYLLLNAALLYRRGQTCGKLVLGIVIVSAGSTVPAPIWKLIGIRALFFPLLFVLLPPYVLIPIIDQMLIFLKPRRCIHDYIAGTEVILHPKFQHTADQPLTGES